jgi:hypothetical protein
MVGSHYSGVLQKLLAGAANAPKVAPKAEVDSSIPKVSNFRSIAVSTTTHGLLQLLGVPLFRQRSRNEGSRSSGQHGPRIRARHNRIVVSHERIRVPHHRRTAQ